MRHCETAFGALIAGCAVMIASSASADSLAQRGFEITGVVPVVCNATFDANAVQSGGTVDLGQVQEFCNSATGYRVIADYNAGNDPGTLIVSGQEVALSSSGETTIGQQAGPAILSQQIAYRPGSTPLTILRITLQANAI